MLSNAFGKALVHRMRSLHSYAVRIVQMQDGSSDALQRRAKSKMKRTTKKTKGTEARPGTAWSK
jgi:hypothetical protein